MFENISMSSLGPLFIALTGGLGIGIGIYHLHLLKKKTTLKTVVESAGKEAEKIKKEKLYDFKVEMQQKRANLVNKGQSYIANISNDSISAAIASNLLEATTVQSRLKEVEAICICVPTPLTENKEPDLSYVIHESEEISKHLQPGQWKYTIHRSLQRIHASHQSGL